MGDRVELYQDAQGRTQTRKVSSAAEVESAIAKDKMQNSPIKIGKQATPKPRPNRSQFPAGPGGDAAFSKAKEKWKADTSETAAQKSALAP